MSEEVKDKIKKQFSFRKWRLGLLVSIVTGLCTGVLTLIVGVTFQQACLIIAGTIAKDLLLFLKNHPIETIEDTVILTKKDLNE